MPLLPNRKGNLSLICLLSLPLYMQMVHREYGDWDSLYPSLQSPIQRSVALLDICCHFWAQYNFVQHVSDNLHLAIYDLAGDLACYAQTPGSVTFHRDISDGVFHHRIDDFSCVFACVGQLGTDSHLGIMDSRLRHFACVCCRLPVYVVRIISAIFLDF